MRRNINVYPLPNGGTTSKGITLGEDAIVKIVAGLCANPEYFGKNPSMIIEDAWKIHHELFRTNNATWTIINRRN